MSDKETGQKIAKIIKENSGKGMSIVGDAKGDLAKVIMEPILKAVAPMLKPALAKLEEFLGEDEKMIIIRKPKGSDGFVVIMDTSNIDQFTTHNSNYKKYSMKEFTEALVSGEMGDLFGEE